MLSYVSAYMGTIIAAIGGSISFAIISTNIGTIVTAIDFSNNITFADPIVTTDSNTYIIS